MTLIEKNSKDKPSGLAPLQKVISKLNRAYVKRSQKINYYNSVLEIMRSSCSHATTKLEGDLGSESSPLGLTLVPISPYLFSSIVVSSSYIFTIDSPCLLYQICIIFSNVNCYLGVVWKKCKGQLYLGCPARSC